MTSIRKGLGTQSTSGHYYWNTADHCRRLCGEAGWRAWVPKINSNGLWSAFTHRLQTTKQDYSLTVLLWLKGKVILVLFWSRGGCVLAPDHTVTNLSWRIFGVIQNPSGFGVFRPVLPRGFKGFGWNVFISQKSLLKVENLVANLAFWPTFI